MATARYQSSVIAVAVVNDGVTPTLTAIFGVTVPEYRILPAPLVAVPTAKCVMVFVPTVHAPNVIVAAGETLLALTVHPPDVRATATRA